MARVPALERVFGQDRLARLHRLVGFTSFTADARPHRADHLGLRRRPDHGRARHGCGSSPSTTRACCWPSQARSAWSSSWSPACAPRAPGCATSRGTCCTSTPTSASGSHYRTSSGPAGLPPVDRPHRVLVGSVIAAAGAVLVWRIGQPLWRNLRHRLVVSEVVPEADGCVSVRMTGRRLDGCPSAQASSSSGASSRPAGRAGTRTRCPRPPTAGACGSRSRTSATAAAPLRALRPGTRVLVEGPYGRLTERARTSSGVAMIGAGVGITPLRALPEELGGHTDDVLLPPLPRRAACRFARARIARRPPRRPARTLPAAGPRRARVLAARALDATRRRRTRCGPGARHRRPRRLRLRPRGLDPGRHAAARAAGAPAAHCTPNSSPGNDGGPPMRRIWSPLHRLRPVLLFSYRTHSRPAGRRCHAGASGLHDYTAASGGGDDQAAGASTAPGTGRHPLGPVQVTSPSPSARSPTSPSAVPAAATAATRNQRLRPAGPRRGDPGRAERQRSTPSPAPPSPATATAVPAVRDRRGATGDRPPGAPERRGRDPVPRSWAMPVQPPHPRATASAPDPGRGAGRGRRVPRTCVRSTGCSAPYRPDSHNEPYPARPPCLYAPESSGHPWVSEVITAV